MSKVIREYFVSMTIKTEVEADEDQEKYLGDLYNDIGLMLVECGWRSGSSLNIQPIVSAPTS